MKQASPDWVAIQEMMNATGGSFRSKTLYQYLVECDRVYGERFDALRL